MSGMRAQRLFVDPRAPEHRGRWVLGPYIVRRNERKGYNFIYEMIEVGEQIAFIDAEKFERLV